MPYQPLITSAEGLRVARALRRTYRIRRRDDGRRHGASWPGVGDGRRNRFLRHARIRLTRQGLGGSAVRSPDSELSHAGLLFWRHVGVSQPVFDSGRDGFPGADRVDAAQKRTQKNAPADRDDESIDAVHRRHGAGEQDPRVGDVEGRIASRRIGPIDNHGTVRSHDHVQRVEVAVHEPIAEQRRGPDPRRGRDPVEAVVEIRQQLTGSSERERRLATVFIIVGPSSRSMTR